MEITKWTDVWQAWAAIGTASFTAASVIMVFVYTVITNKALKIAQRTHEESLRPVVTLVRANRVDGSRIATYRNSGGGLALGLKLRTGKEAVTAPDNALAPGATIDYVIPLQPEQAVLDLAYVSLTKRPIRTISYFLADGTVFNDYFPEATGLTDKQIQGYYRAIEKYAQSAEAAKLVANLPGS